MEEDCPLCLEKGIKSPVTFWQITLDSAILACNNLSCSFPFDRGFRDVIWKRDYRELNKERNPKIKLEDVALKDVKPIDDYFKHLELPDNIADETIEINSTSVVSGESFSVDFSTLLALSEEDAQPLVVNDERNPDNPVSESHCINNSNTSYNMDNSSDIMGDFSFLEIDDEEPEEMRTHKSSGGEETDSGGQSDCDIPVIEIESEDDEEEMDNERQRTVDGNEFHENSLSTMSENFQSEIDDNSLSGIDEAVLCEVEENLPVEANDNDVPSKNVTCDKPVSVHGVKTYIVICKDVVPTFDVDQLKRKGITVEILNPNSSLQTPDNDEPEISSGKDMFGSDYSCLERIGSEPGRPYVVEDKVRIWAGHNNKMGLESEFAVTPAALFHYIVHNFVSKPENGEVGSGAEDRETANSSPTLSEEIQTINENLSTVTIGDDRNESLETDSVPSQELADPASRDKSEHWSRKASKKCSLLKSLTTAVSSNSSTKLVPHSTPLTPSENSVNDGMAFLPWTVAECSKGLYIPRVTKRKCSQKKTYIAKRESACDDSYATTPDVTKETSSGKQISDELNEGFLKESFSSSSSIRRSVKSRKSVMKFGSLFKSSPTAQQARLIKYKVNSIKRTLLRSAKRKVAHWRKSVLSPDTTLESFDVSSSLDIKSLAPSELSTPSVKESDILKTKIDQLTEIYTPSTESTALRNVPESSLSSSVAVELLSNSVEECVTPQSDSCVSESVDISSTKYPSPTKSVPSTKYPSPTKSVPSAKSPLPIRSNCFIRMDYPMKSKTPQLQKAIISSYDTAVSVHSEEEFVTPLCNSCETKSSTSPEVNSTVKSTSPIIDNSTSVSKCSLLNEQTQPADVTSSVELVRTYESEQKELDNISPSATVEERYLQRSKRVQLRRSLKPSIKPTSVKSSVIESPDCSCVEVIILSSPEEISSFNNTVELSETNETTSEVSLPVRGQSPPKSQVPQLKGPSPESDKPRDVQETLPPVTELYVTKSVTSPCGSSVKESAPSLSAVKQRPPLKSYRLRKSLMPPAKSTRLRKPVASSYKSKVACLRKTKVLRSRKRISKSPVSTIVQPPRTTRRSFLSSATDDDLDESQQSCSTSDVKIKPGHNISVTRRSAVSDSSSLKSSVRVSALKASPRSVPSAPSEQSSHPGRTRKVSAQNIKKDLGSGSSSVQQPVRSKTASSIVTEKSTSHSLHTKPVTSANTAVKRSLVNKLSASATSKKLETLHTTRRSTKLSHSLKTASRALTGLVEAASPKKTKETGRCSRSTRSSLISEETSTTRRSTSVIAVNDSVTLLTSKNSAANSTASCASKLSREVAKRKPNASSQVAGVTKVSRRQKHLPIGSVALSPTKTRSSALSSTRLSESNLKENMKCPNVSVVVLKSPAATAALLKLRKESATTSGIQPTVRSTNCSREKHLDTHSMSPVKAAAEPLGKAYVKLRRIPIGEGFDLRHISKFMKEEETFKAEGNCKAVYPSKCQKSDSHLQQILPPGKPSVSELSKKDSIEKENIANSKKRRKYSVDVKSNPKRRSVQNLSSSEENAPHIPSLVALKSQSEQLTVRSRVLPAKARVSQTLLSNKNMSKQVNSSCTRNVVNRESVNTRRLVERVAHQPRVISSVKERRNVQPKLDETNSRYSVKRLVSRERSPYTLKSQELKGTPVRSSVRTRSLKNFKANT